MTLSQSALSELLDAIRASGDVDVAREAYRLVAQELIELEAAQAIGAARYERDGGHGFSPGLITETPQVTEPDGTGGS